jgi:tRNA(Ile)-lysidine synthase
VIEKVREFIAGNDLFREGSGVIAAVSGGADSVALVDILVSYGMGLSLTVAHFNHRLRGADSDADEEFVRCLANRYGLPFRTASADVRELSRAGGCGIEEAGREIRYRYLRGLMEEVGADAVALGHHADDQAETVLMRLIRGAGPRGLSGMSPRAGWKIRPLLEIRRKEIEEYLRERSMIWREDESNSDQAYLRNRIRHSLIPELESYNPAIVSRLAATAGVCAAENSVIAASADDAFTRLSLQKGGDIHLPTAALLQEAKGLRLRLYDLAIRAVKGGAAGIGSDHLLSVDEILHSSRAHRSVSLPGVTVSRCYETVIFTAGRRRSVASGFDLEITGEGRYLLPDKKVLRVRLTGPPEQEISRAEVACFDADAVSFPWRLRNFREGDRLSPFGMTGTKKVKELFREARVPLRDRRSVPLLFDASDNLLWVCGLRRSSTAPVGPGTRRAVVVEFPAVTA